MPTQLFVGPKADSGMNRTVSGCAIMVLVEGLTGIAPASYATDTGLLAELRAGWPPADVPDGGRDGYRPIDLATTEVVGAVRLTDRFGVALCADGEAFLVVPLVRDAADGWRRAAPGDGLSAFVAGVPMASERPIGVDQTHDSVVVGERVIVKWFRRVGPEPSRAMTLLAHLDAVGFESIPTPLGSIAWKSPAGVELTLAHGDTYLPGARDGWDWCDAAVEEGLDPTVGSRLGRLTAQLHAALRQSSPIIAEPIGIADASIVTEWRADARESLESALALTDGDAARELQGYAAGIRRSMDSLRDAGPVALQPIHGDFHVGQVLEWTGGLAVIDFDGNPILRPAANVMRQPIERDIAQMLTSLDHVGRVAQARIDDEDRSSAIDGWIAETRSRFLAAIEPIDARLLEAFEVEQECRELIYAARFLARWQYAPMATLRARFGS
jgi:maltokinase